MDIQTCLRPLFPGLTFLALAASAHGAAPTVANSNVILPGQPEDSATTISYALLLAATGASDSDAGDEIVFRFKGEQSGEVETSGGTAVGTNDTLAAGESWVWTPDDDDNGNLAAFRVRAYDGSSESGLVSISVTVPAVNDAPVFTKGSNVSVDEDLTGYSESGWATAIDEGASDESSQALVFVIDSNSNAGLFAAGPAVSDDGELSFTPAPNQFGSATIGLKLQDDGGTASGGSDESAVQTFTITVTAVNDPPSFTGGGDLPVAEDEDFGSGAGVYSATWATAISAGPNESDTLFFDVTRASGDSDLFSTPPAIDPDTGVLTFVLAANQNGSAEYDVVLRDGASGAGGTLTDTERFKITVGAREDDPVLGGSLVTDLSDADVVGSESAQAYGIFDSLTLTDPDDGEPNAAPQSVTVTIDESAAELGTFKLPADDTPDTSGDSLVYTFTSSSASDAQSKLRAATFQPDSNILPVGDTGSFGVKVETVDGDSRAAAPVEGTLTVESVNDVPVLSASLAVESIGDDQTAKPFIISITDPDIGETFTVDVTRTGGVGGTLSNATGITGDAATVAAAVRNITFRPAQETGEATFQVAVKDSVITTAVTASLAVDVVAVNDVPTIAGVSSTLLRMTDDPVDELFPFTGVTIADADPDEQLTVTLSLDDPAKGSFTGDHFQTGTFQLKGTAAQVTGYLRDVRFEPTPHRLAIGQSEIVTVTISVSDGTAGRSNNDTEIEVTAVDGAPAILWDGGSFPSTLSPTLIDPDPAKPFEQVSLIEDGAIVLTVSLDDPAKGTLTDLGGFTETAAGSGAYRMSGAATEVQAALRGLVFEPSPDYRFPPGQPGRTDFTLVASDAALNTTTRVLPVVLISGSRSFLVTSPLDPVLQPASEGMPAEEPQPGTLRHAVKHARANDVITFALPSYPATIRLRSPLVIDKHLAFAGPGPDKLTISGDANANDTTDAGDVRLFEVVASLHLKGLQLARGFASNGGAVAVARETPEVAAGALVMEDCIVRDCVASQWGGAVDVTEGSLAVERCLFENNSLLASSGLGGGAISLFTHAPCSIVNTTFSGNLQNAPSGYGGGAVYVENDAPAVLFETRITHCTFAGNDDASDRGSSLRSNVSNTRLLLQNNLFADDSARNLQVAGGGEMVSLGGNVSSDYTTTILLQGGVPQLVTLLSHPSDQTNTDPGLLPIATLDGPTRGYRLLPESPGIGGAVPGASGVDQRGVVRNASADSGAIDADAQGKLVVNEISVDTTDGPQFLEFYNPRDQALLDIEGYELWIDGIKRHTFASHRIRPGFGIVVAGGALGGVDARTPVVVPVDDPGDPNDDFEFGLRGLVELRAPGASASVRVAAVGYTAVFADAAVPEDSLDTGASSITLAPQFQGAAYVPHHLVLPPPDGGTDPDGEGDPVSPGADTGDTGFGAPNASPIAVGDQFEADEDLQSVLDVLANDLDADGDALRIIAVDAEPPSGAAPDAGVSATPVADPLRGTRVVFDPVEAFNFLPEGARMTDTFAYTILDFGGGAVMGYESGGAGLTRVLAPAHRLVTGDRVTISDAGPPSYNDSFEVTVVDDDRFSIVAGYVEVTDPTLRGSWLAEAARESGATPAGEVEAYADGGGGTTLVASREHRLDTGDQVTIQGADPASPYNGTFTVTVDDADAFRISAGYTIVADPGLLGTWEATAPKDLSEPDEALVEVIVLGRNDPPAPESDATSTDEETILRVFADAEFAGAGTPLDTDGLYPQPRQVAAGWLLGNDADPDTDDTGESLRVVGVCEPLAIAGFAGSPGSAPVTVSAPAHGLESGTTVLVSNYGGHPSYNAYHPVTVTGPDEFTIPVTFVDDHPSKGFWSLLDDGNRAAATSERGAAVALEIRADRRRTNVVYNPRVSAELDGLAEGESMSDGFYYAVEDRHGAIAVARVEVEVAGVNDAPLPVDDPPAIAELGPSILGGRTLPEFFEGSEVLYLTPSAAGDGRFDVTLTGPGGESAGVIVVPGFDRTDEDTAIGLATSTLLANDRDIDRSDMLGVELGGILSREGARIRLSADGSMLTYDPSVAPGIQALSSEERIIDTFVIRVSDGIAPVDSLVAILVEGTNDRPQAGDVALETDERTEVVRPAPGLILNGSEIDQNIHLPDDRRFLLPVPAVETTVAGATAEVVLERLDGIIDGLGPASGMPGVTVLNSTDHGLNSGQEVVILELGGLTGQYPVTRVDADRFSIPVAYDPAFAAAAGGRWTSLASRFHYDPTGSVFSGPSGAPEFTLQGLAEGESFTDRFIYTLLDGSHLFANDDVYRVEADRVALELRVMDNDVSLDGVASSREIVAVGPPSDGGTLAIQEGQSLLYTPQTGFVGDEVFVYTIEDDLGNRDSATVTVRVTVDRLNGNLRANDDAFTVAAGESPLLEVLANDSIVPATGDPLTLLSLGTPDAGGQLSIEDGAIRYTPAPAAGYPLTETFTYTMSGGGSATATATVRVLVDTKTIPVRDDSFGVPAGGVDVALNVLGNDNILPGDGSSLEIVSVTSAGAGSVEIVDGAFLAYTPNAGFLGEDEFSYGVSDGLGGTGTATVTVRVGSITVNSDIFAVAVDPTDDTTRTRLDVLANDGVLQGGGGELTITGVTPELSPVGRMYWETDALYFDPARDAATQADFTYTVTDDGGRSATATVTVALIADGVRASSDFFTVRTDSADNPLTVLANDLLITNLDSELSVSRIGTGTDAPDQGGTVEISEDFKSLSYTPPAGFTGTESFTYTVTDGETSDTARVSVRSTSGAMVAGDDAFLVFRGSSGNRLAVLANDRVIPEGGQLLSITAIGDDAGNASNPPHRGVLEIVDEGLALSYTPSPDNTSYPFEETFTYEISAGGTARTEGRIRLEVLDRVTARELETNDDAFSVASDGSGTSLPVLANDGILPADASSWQIVSATAPAANVCSPFLVTDFPDPSGLAARLAGQGDPLSVFLWARLDGTSQALFDNPSAGDDALRAALVGEFNEVVTSGASIHSPTRFDGVPLRAATQALLDEGASGEQLIVLNRLLLEDALPAFLRESTGAGTVQISGNTLVFVPQPGFVGRARFTYRVSDGFGGGGSAEVIVRVGDVSVSDDHFTVLAGGGPVGLDVTANDGVLRAAFPADPDPAQADFTLSLVRPTQVDPPAAGAAVVDGGVLRFTADAGFTGEAVLTYWVEDDAGCAFPGRAIVDVRPPDDDRDSAEVAILVHGVNDPPMLLGADPSATGDKSALLPFAGATVLEYDEQRGQRVILTLTYPEAHGELQGNFIRVSPGVIRLEGTAAELTAALRGLLFVPYQNRIPVGQTEDSGFSVRMDDGFVATPVVVDTAVTTVTPENDPPVLTGTVGDQRLYQHASIRPFVGVDIRDIDDLGLQSQRVSVALDDAIKGEFSSLGGFVRESAGVYVFNGPPAAAAAAIRGLVFTPTPGDRVTPGSPETVTLMVTVDDGFAEPVVDEVTTLVVLHGEVDKLLPLDPDGDDVSQPGADYGGSVAISGDTIVVGSAMRDEGGRLDLGRVFVYERNAGLRAPWGQVQEVAGSDSVVGDRFGSAVDLVGDVLVVGAPGADPGINNIGAAYVFNRDPSDPNRWNEVAKLIPPENNGPGVGNDAFGTAVAVAGDTILVGAPNGNLPGAPRSGRVFVFRRIAGSWDHTQTLLAPETHPSGITGDGEFFGRALDLEGNTAVVGAPGANRSGDGSDVSLGAVHVFRRTDESADWTHAVQIDDFDDPEAVNHRGLGHSVDLDGDRLAIGVYSGGSPGGGFRPGEVRIHERDAGAAAQWGRVQAILPPEGVPSTHFGHSASLAGELLMIGAPGASLESGDRRGRSHLFRRDAGSGQWVAIDRFIPGSAGDRFGHSAGIDGFTAVVGAVDDSENETGASLAGGARVYQFQYDLGPRQALSVPDQLAYQDTPFTFELPAETFLDPVYGDELALGVMLADGSPLPAGGWLSFDPLAGRFSGTPTPGERRSYELVLYADNPLGTRTLSNAFRVDVVLPPDADCAEAYALWVTGQFAPEVLADAGLEASVWGMQANPDGDPYCNLLEMLFGTSATEATPTQSTVRKLAGSQLLVSFPLSDAFPEDCVKVEWSSDLQEWSTEGVSMSFEGAGPGMRQVSALVAPPGEHPRLFVRIGTTESGGVPDFQVLYDAWTPTHFPPGVINDPGLEATRWGMAADPDGDRLCNAVEMLFGTSPVVWNPRPAAFEPRPGGGGTLDFPVADGFPEEFVHVEWSTDLRVWSRDAVSLSYAPGGGGTRQASALVSPAGGPPRLFVRIVPGP